MVPKKVGCISLNFEQFEKPALKNRLRATGGRALYHETDLPFFATLLFGHVS